MVILNSNFNLTLPEQEWTTAVYQYKLQTPETLGIFKGTGRCSDEDEKEYVVLKMLVKPNDPMLNNMISRFEAAKTLDKRLFILSQQILRDNQYIYFCYESFDHNLQTLMEAVVNGDATEDEWEMVVTGCIKALHHLHTTNITHGHITPYNLVRKNGIGYLMGGVGDTFTPDLVWGQVQEDDAFKHDVKRLVEAITTCIPPTMNAVEVNFLLKFLQRRQTMNRIQYHPYVQSSTGVLALFVSAYDILDKDCNSTKGSFKIKVQNYLAIFSDVVKRNQYIGSLNWIARVPPNSVLQAVLKHRNGNYLENDVELFRFWRNVFVHAVKRSQDNVQQHHDALYNMMTTIWPGFAHIVYEVIYDTRYGVFL
ncbi:hypothetical protein PIB30_079021 [Stylosanthes scabra]|uniref:Protein kinase domain-containing protein n=1 Tax=Stylosanthes scabra TaxID=79078 RepID=A0ABU6SRE4_9FABA|nr:hypothetical protein [Stylosanthes scabra]